MQKKYEGQVAVVGVAGRDELSAMSRFINDTGVGGFPHIADVDGSVWSGFGVGSQPSFVFINDDGSAGIFVGAMGEEGLSSAIDELIAT